ncbi:protein kinase [Microbacterium sp. NPDC090007]|uniref:serine/threonine-protein kinase n=1 Tax=Microbacterium sp. NPDC090007 TaxID=3364204 RepID=UPI0037F51797
MSHAPDLPMPRTGDILGGRYILRERIGAGGRGRVFRARDEVLARDVAIKVFPVGGADEPASTRRMSEARDLAVLDHPSLVTLYDARLGAGDHVYLVMELVDGPSLRRRLDEAPVPAREVAALLGDLAGALAVVHAAGIVHRDVKPSNVLLRPVRGRDVPFEAVLVDFGVAHLVDAAQSTPPGPVVGTAASLAPEQLRGEPPRPASDVYALGRLALEALTRRPSFGADSPREGVPSRPARRPEVPADLGDGWRSLLTAMTAPDPDARPSASEVARRASTLVPGSEELETRPLRTTPWADDRVRARVAVSAPTPGGAAVVGGSPAQPPVTTPEEGGAGRGVAEPGGSRGETTRAAASVSRAGKSRRRTLRGRRVIWATAASAAVVVVGGHLLAFSLGAAGGATTDRPPLPASSPSPALAERSTPAPAPTSAVAPVSSTDADPAPSPRGRVDEGPVPSTPAAPTLSARATPPVGEPQPASGRPSDPAVDVTPGPTPVVEPSITPSPTPDTDADPDPDPRPDDGVLPGEGGSAPEPTMPGAIRGEGPVLRPGTSASGR